MGSDSFSREAVSKLNCWTPAGGAEWLGVRNPFPTFGDQNIEVESARAWDKHRSVFSRQLTT